MKIFLILKINLGISHIKHFFMKKKMSMLN